MGMLFEGRGEGEGKEGVCRMKKEGCFWRAGGGGEGGKIPRTGGMRR
jgi:hypothetical protein